MIESADMWLFFFKRTKQCDLLAFQNNFHRAGTGKEERQNISKGVSGLELLGSCDLNTEVRWEHRARWLGSGSGCLQCSREDATHPYPNVPTLDTHHSMQLEGLASCG